MSGNAEQKIPKAKYLNTSFLGYLTVPRAPAAIACVKIEATGLLSQFQFNKSFISPKRFVLNNTIKHCCTKESIPFVLRATRISSYVNPMSDRVFKEVMQREHLFCTDLLTELRYQIEY